MSSILHTAMVVAWAFLGVRKNSDYRNDLARLNPLHIVLAGFVAVVLLVAGMVAFVHWVVG